jgi:hypothetical protein
VDDKERDAGVVAAISSFNMRIPSFVAVVLMPYTPTAANLHHHSHRIATVDISTVRCFMCDIDGNDGILLEIPSLKREITDAAVDGIIDDILFEIRSFARERAEVAIALADSFLSIISFLIFSSTFRADSRTSRAHSSIALLTSVVDLVAKCRTSSVAFAAADFIPFVAFSDAPETARAASSLARASEFAVVEVRESISLPHLEFEAKYLLL